VYDERKGIIEYPQKLIAIIGEDKIEAWLGEKSYSFIKFNGKTIKRKQRII
jgi:hypothetical protein